MTSILYKGLVMGFIINSIYIRVATYHIVGAHLSAELTAHDENIVVYDASRARDLIVEKRKSRWRS